MPIVEEKVILRYRECTVVREYSKAFDKSTYYITGPGFFRVECLNMEEAFKICVDKAIADYNEYVGQKEKRR